MKSVSHVRHTTNFSVVPMVILGDYQSVISKIWETSKLLIGVSQDIVVTELEECNLDPGGMEFTKIPFAHFKIDGFPFKVRHTNISFMLDLLEEPVERIPGYYRIPMFSWFLLLPVHLLLPLKKELETLLKSDSELHAQLDKANSLETLEQTGTFIDVNTMKENSAFDLFDSDPECNENSLKPEEFDLFDFESESE